jgi:pimeloyl-ACP methyl ester carboxylesterase
MSAHQAVRSSGLAAYFLDHDARSYELISRVFAGESAGLTRDDILDNITITWLTNTALSGARLVSIPVAVSVFPDELYPAPRSWAERAYPKLIHYNKLDKGGHFAAWEQPKLLLDEIRAGFRQLRASWSRRRSTAGGAGSQSSCCSTLIAAAPGRRRLSSKIHLRRV